MGGAPCIRRPRIPGAIVVTMIADGMTSDENINNLPDLTPDDVTDALRYAGEPELPLPTVT